MELGVAGMLGAARREDALRVRDMGFGTASWHLAELSWADEEARLEAAREALAEAELALCQLLPPLYPSLVHPDATVRAAGVESLGRVIRAGAQIGAGNVYVRPGSLNPAGPWTPHPENHHLETRRRLVESLRQVVEHAVRWGVPLALEGHVVSPLHNAEVVREVLEQVGCPLLGVNADLVNFVSTLDEAYENTALINNWFDLLGEYVLAAHAKDVTVLDRLVVHIEECVPGQGHLDQETMLRRFAQSCPEGAVLIEHLPAERVPEARRALLELASRAGVELHTR